MKKSIMLAIGLCFLAPSLFAKGKISNELAIVKACNEAVADNLFDLSMVYDASVTDTGKSLKVELHYKEADASCIQPFWYKYNGVSTVCELCQGEGEDESLCICLGKICVLNNPPLPFPEDGPEIEFP